MMEWLAWLGRLTGQQDGQIHLVLLAPLFTLLLLSLLVHTASSAIDPALEKQKVNEQLKRRLSELQSDRVAPSLSVEAAPVVVPSSPSASAAEETSPAPAEPSVLVPIWQVEEGDRSSGLPFVESRGE